MFWEEIIGGVDNLRRVVRFRIIIESIGIARYGFKIIRVLRFYFEDWGCNLVVDYYV